MLRGKSEFANRVARQKILKSLTGLRLVIGVEKRKENVTKRTRRNITKREEKRELKGVNYAKNVVTE